MSREVSTSLMREAREDIRMVVGPWNLKNKESPHIVLLAAVLRLNSKLVKPLQNAPSRITRKNLMSGTK